MLRTWMLQSWHMKASKLGYGKMQVQFHARGPSGVGRVSADMYKDSSKQWQYLFLYVDADVPVPSRVTIISPSS